MKKATTILAVLLLAGGALSGQSGPRMINGERVYQAVIRENSYVRSSNVVHISGNALPALTEISGHAEIIDSKEEFYSTLLLQRQLLGLSVLGLAQDDVDIVAEEIPPNEEGTFRVAAEWYAAAVGDYDGREGKAEGLDKFLTLIEENFSIPREKCRAYYETAITREIMNTANRMVELKAAYPTDARMRGAMQPLIDYYLGAGAKEQLVRRIAEIKADELRGVDNLSTIAPISDGYLLTVNLLSARIAGDISLEVSNEAGRLISLHHMSQSKD